MSNSNRDSGGKYTASVSDEDILTAIDHTSGPVATAAELADILPIGRRAIRERLLDLRERGDVDRKTVGARSVVWWRTTDSNDEATPDFRAGYGAFAGSDFAEQVEAVSDELDRDFQESEQELFDETDTDGDADA
ncbi:hypothetical protein HAPAU_39430 [Halalkalicoccus paucihalophilus]|uniref:HTH domain protein n=1 Tax=Halalkalicoccus paucihalophilus TaxID=1008153 RepID=A0A151A8E6_9EURY|nr:hypothetical protein [Halalkalicoccus paucihalophilus]KYH23864.1 hypothetical protein HAPAU_39430 [Halalkalicoccus paucihalophilus]